MRNRPRLGLVALLAVLCALIVPGAILAFHSKHSAAAPKPEHVATHPLPAITSKPSKPVYPSLTRIEKTRHWLEHRQGVTAFAVIDSRGQLHGWHLYQQHDSASLVKAMLLVAYLRRLGPHHRLNSYDQSLIYPMIHESNNEAATAVYNIVGDAGLDEVARVAKMRDFEPGGSLWGLSEISAADQARFFYHQDEYIPKRDVGYARYLLSHIEPEQRWGIPRAAGGTPFAVFFKGGWLPDRGIENQAARLERPGYTFSLAVLTSGNPSEEYGQDTEEGVASHLLGRQSVTPSGDPDEGEASDSPAESEEE